MNGHLKITLKLKFAYCILYFAGNIVHPHTLMFKVDMSIRSHYVVLVLVLVPIYELFIR